MEHGRRGLIVALLLGLLLAGAAQASSPNYALVRATPDGTTITLDVLVRIIDPLPPEYVGWLVRRSIVGNCADPITVVPLHPLPDGAQTYHFVDDGLEEGVTYLYQISFVDDQGGLHAPPFNPGFESWVDFMDTASLGDAPIALGVLSCSSGGSCWIDLCTENCWDYFLWLTLTDVPEDLRALEGHIVMLYGGDISWELESYPMLYEAPHAWYLVDSCGIVENTATSWSALKRRYR